MENAITRNTGAFGFTAKHLHASALAALRDCQQVNVAERLGIAASTVLRRSEKYPEVMENLAGSGVKDFVFDGERKVGNDEYQFLLKSVKELMELKLKFLQEKAPAATEAI